MLELMALDQAPSLLLGRPCQHGLDPACDPTLWTIGRYGEPVVASLVAALRRELHAIRASGRSAQGVVLIGYSGGGTLAFLVAERVTETRAVVTLAGNLDTKRWAEHHGYFPLGLSLNPAERPPLDASVIQIHLLAGQDERVPPFLTEAVIARQKEANFHLHEAFDHECCWAAVWRATLAELDVLLEDPLDR
jgi:dienelactone hydrolase